MFKRPPRIYRTGRLESLENIGKSAQDLEVDEEEQLRLPQDSGDEKLYEFHGLGVDVAEEVLIASLAESTNSIIFCSNLGALEALLVAQCYSNK